MGLKRRTWTLAGLGSTAALVLAVGLTACARDSGRDSSRVAQAIANLRSGSVVRAIEEAARKAQPPGSLQHVLQPAPRIPLPEEASPKAPPKQAGLGYSSAAIAGELEAARAALDACDVPRNLGPEEASPVLRAAMLEFGRCLTELLRPARAAEDTFHYLKYFELPAGVTADEVAHYTSAELVKLVFQGAPVRSSFSDEELVLLAALARRRLEALRQTEPVLLGALERWSPTIDAFSEWVNRYDALRALLRTHEDKTGAAFAQALLPIMRSAGMSAELPPDWALPALRFYAIDALVPMPGKGAVALNRQTESPFYVLEDALASLGGSPARAQALIRAYREWRDRDNPALPEHPPAAADAVRVVVLDSGLDARSFPELGLFLGPSRDYADDDDNPWLPAIRPDFTHGSGVLATVLTILSHQAPKMLEARQVDFAFWKVQSLRQLLSGLSRDDARWESRMGFQDAVLTEGLAAAAGAQARRVVSVSSGFNLAARLKKTRQAELLARLPWLWAMAAGNNVVDLEDEPIPHCLRDLSEEQRPSAGAGAILCVGALRGDRVVSNYGPAVDVYAQDSYHELCPDGTSCATPAVTAALAVLSWKFPGLSPAQLKAVILETAETRTLEVAASPAFTREVKVFDPPRMLEKALEKAARLAP